MSLTAFQGDAFQNDAFQVGAPVVDVHAGTAARAPSMGIWYRAPVPPLHVPVAAGQVEGEGGGILSAFSMEASGIVTRPTLRELLTIASALWADADTDVELAEAAREMSLAKARCEAEGITLAEAARRIARGDKR